MAKSKTITGLDCSAAAEEMIRLVLSAQVRSMCKLRKKALDWKDPEGVHQMRVISRRLRSAISDFRPFLRRPNLPQPKLRVIADALGAVRDQDVALVALEALEAKANPEAAEGIALIVAEHRQRRNEARTNLKIHIKRSWIAEFRDEFQAELENVSLRHVKSETEEDESISFRAIGREIILARINELLDASPNFYLPFNVEELHELRILTKRMRYAVELFSGCWPRMGDAAREIALLQTSLGELHDCDVWLENLGKRLKHLAHLNKTDDASRKLRAGGAWLIKHFARERTEHYRNAVSRWEEWQAGSFLDLLQSTLELSSPPKIHS
jgi:CHAD domain-containing protein